VIEMTKVKGSEWFLFASMLTMVSIMHLTDIIDQSTSLFLVIIFTVALLFKNYFIEDVTRVSFDTDIDFEKHEKFIDSLNLKRWMNLYALIIAIVFFRILDMANYFRFDSSMALTLMMFGLGFVFRKEIGDYLDYFKGRSAIKSYEETEMAIIDSIYASRTAFVILVSTFFLIFASSVGILTALEGFFTFIFITGYGLYSYRFSLNADTNRIYEEIFKTSNTSRRRACSYV